MLKFFAPLLEDAAMAIIYYTGRERLSPVEIERLTLGKNIYIQQSRPGDLTATVGTVISSISASDELVAADDEQEDIPLKMRKQWCILYCGGSKKICEMLSDYSEKIGSGVP